jgi:phenylpropionate dioxygenase-like ring-hydroxylating dioxygenase large terminal subunit
VDPAAQSEMVARIAEMHEGRTTTLAEKGAEIPAATYVDPVLHHEERARVFRARPAFAAMSVDLAAPGDVATVDVGGVPIVVVRGHDGAAHAYLNVCRHRATRLVDGPGHVARTFNCPFHGWVYDIDDGHLVAQPRSCTGFDDLDLTQLGLHPRPVDERHGMIVVDPRPDAALDIDAWLGAFAPQVAERDYEHLVPYRTHTSTWACNWKLLLDTFLESYHVFALHRESLAAYLGVASPFDAYGDHNRIVVPQSTVLDQCDGPPESWRLLPHVVLQFFLAPNLIISNINDYVLTWRFLPDAVDRTTVQLSMYTVGPIVDDAQREHLEVRFAAAISVTGDEDFPESERIHRNLESGVVTHTRAGRNEPGIIHFHQMLAGSGS